MKFKMVNNENSSAYSPPGGAHWPLPSIHKVVNRIYA